jgi:hypothetical protein
MFNTDKIVRAATAAVGALILTAVAVGAAAGPAGAYNNGPNLFAAAKVEGQANA